MNKTPNRAFPLMAGAAVQLCVGIIYIWSIFKMPLTEYYSAFVDAGYASTCVTVTYSIMLALFVAGIVVGGRMNDKLGPRPVVLMGGILFGAGIVLSAAAVQFFPTQPWMICLFYGAIAGFGVGAAYTSTISTAQKWFPDKRGFATGVIVCAFGTSTVLFTPVANSLLKSTSIPQTFLTMGCVFLGVVLIFVWFIKNPPQEFLDKLPITAQQASAQKQFTPAETLRTRSMYMLIFCMMFITPGFFILNPMFKSVAELRGLSETAAVAGVMVTGIASTLGRLTAPWFSDRIGRKNVLILMTSINLASVVLLAFAQSYAFMVFIATLAYAFGGGAGIFPAISADYFGTKNAGANYGIVMCGFAASALVFPNLAAALEPGSTPTIISFIVPMVVGVAALVIALLIRPPAQAKIGMVQKD